MERAKAKGEDRIEFTLNQLKKMSHEDDEKDKEERVHVSSKGKRGVSNDSTL